MERTLVILKPDAVQRGLVGEIVSRFERSGLKLTALDLRQVDEALARTHYAVHEGKPFFDGLIEYITSGPVVLMALDGPDAIAVVRKLVGATAPKAAEAGSIRGDLGLMIGRNLIHASDGPDTARDELALWFGAGDLLDYARDIDRWIYE